MKVFVFFKKSYLFKAAGILLVAGFVTPAFSSGLSFRTCEIKYRTLSKKCNELKTKLEYNNIRKKAMETQKDLQEECNAVASECSSYWVSSCSCYHIAEKALLDCRHITQKQCIKKSSVSTNHNTTTWSGTGGASGDHSATNTDDDKAQTICKNVKKKLGEDVDTECGTKLDCITFNEKLNMKESAIFERALRNLYGIFHLDQCRRKDIFKEAFIEACTNRLSNMKTNNKSVLLCPEVEKAIENKTECKDFCATKGFDKFYNNLYNMNSVFHSSNSFGKTIFAQYFAKEFEVQSTQIISKLNCSGNVLSSCGTLPIAYLVLTKPIAWSKEQLLGIGAANTNSAMSAASSPATKSSPSSEGSYLAPLEVETPLDKWINKALFGSTESQKAKLTTEAQEKGFKWLEPCDIRKRSKDQPNNNQMKCEVETRRAITEAGKECSRLTGKVTSCCASPINCVDEDNSIPALNTGFATILALKESIKQIHIHSGGQHTDPEEQRQEMCKRMKQAAIGGGVTSGLLASLCLGMEQMCKTNCKKATDKAFEVLEKHCSHQPGSTQMAALKQGKGVGYNENFKCTEKFFEEYSKEYRGLRQLLPDCSKAASANQANFMAMGMDATQYFMQEAGCEPRPPLPECTGDLRADEKNGNYGCSRDCKKFKDQPACNCNNPATAHAGCKQCQQDPTLKECLPNPCKERPMSADCIDCSLKKNKNHKHCSGFMGGGGTDCSVAENANHPDCRPNGEYPENPIEEPADAANVEEGAPPASGLLSGGSAGGGGGLGGLGSMYGGGGADTGRKRRGNRKPQSILQGFKGRGQFGGYGLNGGPGQNGSGAGSGGKKAKNKKMKVDLGKYFKKKGRLSGVHTSLFNRISKRFQWMCKQGKMQCS